MADNKLTATDVASLGTGAYSLVSGILAKKPGQFKATKYKAVIRPARGNDEMLARQKNEIAGQVSSATRDVNRIAGSDIGQSIAARLAIQRQANDATIQAEATNAQLLREDEVRQSSEQNQEGQINAQYGNQADQINFENDVENYRNKVDQARQGVNSTLNYFAQREGNLKNNEVAERAAKEQVDAIRGAAYQHAYTQSIVAGRTPAQAKKDAEAATAQYRYSNIYPQGK